MHRCWRGSSFMARPESAARFYLEHYAPLYALTPSALDAAYVSQIHNTGQGGVIVIYQQQANGIDVYNTALKVLMTPAMELVAITGNLHSAAAPVVKRPAPFRLFPEDAIAKSFNDYFKTNITSAAFSDLNRPAHGYSFYELRDTPETALQKIGLSRPARIKQVYFPMPETLVPAYYIELWTSEKPGSSVLYAYVIAADDGRLLERKSLTKEAAFSYRVWSEGAPTYTPPDGPLNDFTPHPTGVADNSYPTFNTMPPLVTVDGFNTNPMSTFDSWLPAGATQTLGNNVDAYVDLDATDVFSGTDFRADTTGANTFDRVYNTAQAPTSTNQRKASIRQLFFDNNYSHDYWYDSGFNEAAGNAQANNFGRGGVEGNVLLAEAQDASGTDNANMSTPADGDSPRMQM